MGAIKKLVEIKEEKCDCGVDDINPDQHKLSCPYIQAAYKLKDELNEDRNQRTDRRNSKSGISIHVDLL